MIKGKSLGCLLLLALVMSPAATGNAEQQQQAPQPAVSSDKAAVPAIEPRAVDILKASCNRLAAAHSMRVTAVVSYENPSRPGPPLIYTTMSEVTLKRPDKLRVITPGDGPASEFYYDGKTVMAFSPAENLVAIAEAPPTIDAMLKEAYHYAAIYFPFTDMMVADPYKDIADGLTLAFYIGQSGVVGGTVTDMVAYETHGVFVQVWIGTDDKLPRMARAVFRNDPAQLRHQLEFSNWQLDIALPDGDFASAKAAGGKRIPFARPDANPAPGVKSQSESTPSKTK